MSVNNINQPKTYRKPTVQPFTPGVPGTPVEKGKFWHLTLTFKISLATILLLLALALVIPQKFESAVAVISGFISDNLSWYYVLAASGFVLFMGYLVFSRHGDLTLGKDDDEPEYSTATWFAMLFAAGMGIGLVFYGAAEPLSHFASPAPGIHGTSAEVARAAMATTYLHWGLHAWSIYVVVGLSVAWAHHRLGHPISIRWTLHPLLGDRVKGKLGDVIDITAIIGTLLGVSTSLGFGVTQLSAGIEYATGFHSSQWLKVVMVLAISGLATLSVASGLDKGIKILSNLNLGLAAMLAAAVLFIGPTAFILNEFAQSIGIYLDQFFYLAFKTHPFQGATGIKWVSSWTTYYWGWWISWSPFVGIFIARISKGRTVREFVAGVVLVPTLVTFLWFAIMGGNGLYQQILTNVDLFDNGLVDVNTILFKTFDWLGWPILFTVLAMILLVIFFVTSADSGSFVLAMLSTNGNNAPSTAMRITWASMIGLVTAVLLGASTTNAGMAALQSLVISAALPFSVVMIVMCVSLSKSLSDEYRIILRRQRVERSKQLVEHLSTQIIKNVQDSIESSQEEESKAEQNQTSVKTDSSRKEPRRKMGMQSRSAVEGSRVKKLLPRFQRFQKPQQEDAKNEDTKNSVVDTAATTLTENQNTED